MAMVVVLAAVLLTYGVSTGIAMEAGESGAVAGARAGGNGELPLDMAEDSVDDMYDKCKEEMKEKVVTEYLQNETNNNSNFKAVWESQESLVKKKYKKRGQLGKDQIVAIRTYTDKSNVYLDFNKAVRTQRPEYNTTFVNHTLHFFLTTAIQALRAKQETQCLIGYRRVNVSFSQDVENKEIRFGSFTSASTGDYSSNIEKFGDKSCFNISTCMGADISLYSQFGEAEREVLIPPYEVFKVVEIKNRSMHSDLPCEVEYRVESTGTPVSNLNCTLFPK